MQRVVYIVSLMMVYGLSSPGQNVYSLQSGSYFFTNTNSLVVLDTSAFSNTMQALAPATDAPEATGQFTSVTPIPPVLWFILGLLCVLVVVVIAGIMLRRRRKEDDAEGW